MGLNICNDVRNTPTKDVATNSKLNNRSDYTLIQELKCLYLKIVWLLLNIKPLEI